MISPFSFRLNAKYQNLRLFHPPTSIILRATRQHCGLFLAAGSGVVKAHGPRAYAGARCAANLEHVKEKLLVCHRPRSGLIKHRRGSSKSYICTMCSTHAATDTLRPRHRTKGPPCSLPLGYCAHHSHHQTPSNNGDFIGNCSRNLPSRSSDTPHAGRQSVADSSTQDVRADKTHLFPQQSQPLLQAHPRFRPVFYQH